jgi:biopolymer transport protein ExbD
MAPGPTPDGRQRSNAFESGDWVAFAVVALSIVLALLFAVRAPLVRPRPSLPPAPESYWREEHSHATAILVIELPDSGGYLANGSPFRASDLRSLLRQVVQIRPWIARGLFLRAGQTRSTDAIDSILTAAAAAGWQVYDADKSGFPAFAPPQQIPGR